MPRGLQSVMWRLSGGRCKVRGRAMFVGRRSICLGGFSQWYGALRVVDGCIRILAREICASGASVCSVD